MLAEVEDAMIERCRRVVGDHVQTIEDLPSGWTAQLLNAARRKVPGIYISWGGGRGDGDAQSATLAGRYVVYVVTGHASGERERRRGNNRQVGAYELLERIIPALHTLTVPDVGSLTLQSVDNLYSDQLDRQGVVVYGAAFRLGMTFPAPFDLGDLANFELYTGTHRIGGEDDPDTESRAVLPQEED